MTSAQKIGKLTLDHVRSVVGINTRLLWSYVTDAIGASILNVLPPQEAPLYMEGLSFVKNVKGKLFMKASGYNGGLFSSQLLMGGQVTRGFG